MFLILTQPTLQDSTADLFEEELKQNIATAIATVECSLKLYSVDDHDVAMNFNIFTWQRHMLALLTYSNIMVETLFHRWPKTSLRVKNLQSKALDYIEIYGADPDQEIGLPHWSKKHACLEAMRSHLIYRNGQYGTLWPELGPSMFPFPKGQGLEAYA